MSWFACLEKTFHKKCLYFKISLINYVFVLLIVTFLVAQMDAAPMSSPSGGRAFSDPLRREAESSAAQQPSLVQGSSVPELAAMAQGSCLVYLLAGQGQSRLF